MKSADLLFLFSLSAFRDRFRRLKSDRLLSLGHALISICSFQAQDFMDSLVAAVHLRASALPCTSRPSLPSQLLFIGRAEAGHQRRVLQARNLPISKATTQEDNSDPTE
jgi:hypothetical protein